MQPAADPWGGQGGVRGPSKAEGLQGQPVAGGNPSHPRKWRGEKAHLRTWQPSPSVAVLGFSYLVSFETSCRSEHKLVFHKTNKAPSWDIWKKCFQGIFLVWVWFSLVSRSDCSGQTPCPRLCLPLLLASACLQQAPSCPNATVLSRQDIHISGCPDCSFPLCSHWPYTQSGFLGREPESKWKLFCVPWDFSRVLGCLETTSAIGAIHNTIW